MLCLKFKATLKVDKEVDDLELNFKGTREEDSSLIIANYELKDISGMLYVITKNNCPFIQANLLRVLI